MVTEVSEHESESYGQDKHEGGLNKYDSTSPFIMNGILEKTPRNQACIVLDRVDRGEPNLTEELLKSHHIFGHCSFHKLHIMVDKRILPKRLEKCVIPVFSSCLHARINRIQWRKGSKNNTNEAKDPTSSRDVISVDQLKSSIPGLIDQMKGFLTTNRYQ